MVMTKVADLQVINNKCYIRLNNCSNDEFVNIIDYKSWFFKSWEYGLERKYFSYIYLNRENEKVLWCYIGFSPILIRYLQSLGYHINGKELYRAREISIGDTFYKPWDFQSEAINSWMNSGCFGVIKIPTGGGKSFTACNIIKKMGVRTIISVHTNDLLINAWYNTLIEQFGESIKSRLGIVGGKLTKKDRKHMRLIADTSYESNIRQDIVIATSQSLINKLDKLANEKFGLLVIDECHHYSSEQFSKVAGSIRAPYRLGLSATVNRPDGTSPLFYGLLGDVVYMIKIRELVEKGVLVSPIFNSIIINDEQVQSNIASCGLAKLDLSRYVKQASASSVVKKNYILKLAKSLSMNKKKFIMYADFVNSNNGVFTRDYYVKELNDAGVKVIGVSSDMGGKEREKVFKLLQNDKIDGLIMGKLGAEGVNIPKVDSVLMCNASKSTILFPQRVGRAMRSVRDDSSKKNAYIYEVLLNTPMEMRWSDGNFYEYQIEKYKKEKVYMR